MCLTQKVFASTVNTIIHIIITILVLKYSNKSKKILSCFQRILLITS